MNFAVSNIAWPETARDAAYAVLSARAVRGLEIAPGLFFAGAADPFAPEAALAEARMAEIAAHDLHLVSMQSLLFGVEGAALFEGPAALERFRNGMQRAIDLAARFGIPNLVFGSPKQRVIPAQMSPETAQAQAAEVFSHLGDQAVAAGTVIAMEANPRQYGTNFLTNAQDVLAFVRHVDHPGVRMVMDIGAMHLNDTFAQSGAVIAEAAPLLSHVHISEPYLAPAPARRDTAESVLRWLAAAGYDRWISIEMKATQIDPVPDMQSALDRLLEAAHAVQTEEPASG